MAKVRSDTHFLPQSLILCLQIWKAFYHLCKWYNQMCCKAAQLEFWEKKSRFFFKAKPQIGGHH